jgi:Tol biopolymer transport system component
MKHKIFIYFLVITLSFSLLCCDKQPFNPDFEDDDVLLIDSEPAWCSDGSMIVYSHMDSLSIVSGLYIINADGTDCRQLCSGFCESPAWSFDNKWISFSQNGHIWKIKPSGDSLTQITSDGKCFFSSWSPQGYDIIFDALYTKFKFYGIWLYENDNYNMNSPIKYDSLQGDIRMPEWGSINRIFYVRYSPAFFSTEIFYSDQNGENEVQLTYNNATNYYPRYSNDNRLLFTTISKDSSIPSICIIDSIGNNLKLVLKNAFSGDWSPDCKKIVYTDSKSGRLYIVDLSDKYSSRLTY